MFTPQYYLFSLLGGTSPPATVMTPECGEAIEDKDVYSSNHQSRDSLADKQSDQIQKGYSQDYSQTRLEQSSDDAPLPLGENSESNGQPQSFDCGDAASDAIGDNFSANQDGKLHDAIL